MAALDKIFDLLDTEPDMVDAADAIDPGRLRGEIEMDGVSFSYPDEGNDWRCRTSTCMCPPANPGLGRLDRCGQSTFAKLVARLRPAAWPGSGGRA